MNYNTKIADYVKTVYLLREKGPVRGAYIARELGVTKPTVSVSIKDFVREGYLKILPDRSVELTEEGEEIARGVIERCGLVYGLLSGLGVDDETARRDSDSIGRCISDESLSALSELRDYLSVIRKTPFGKTEP